MLRQAVRPGVSLAHAMRQSVRLSAHRAGVAAQGVATDAVGSADAGSEAADEALLLARTALLPQPVRTDVTWAKGKTRSGVLAWKLGMLPVWDKWGVRLPCTVLHVDQCRVLQQKTMQRDGYTAVQLGLGTAKAKNTTQPMLGHVMISGSEPAREIQEFRVHEDALLPTGHEISVLHFVPGQFVDVAGITIGKGFQGPMKRWNFAGLRATHGVSKAHRSHGSTGQRKSPGKVFKNKKMAGHMGVRRRTVQSLRLYKIDVDRNLLYVVGHVPGHRNHWVRVSDAVKKTKMWHRDFMPPFPTYVPPAGDGDSDGDNVVGELIMDEGDVDPMVPFEDGGPRTSNKGNRKK